METNGLLLKKKIGLTMIWELVKMTTLLLILTETLAHLIMIHTQLVVEATIQQTLLLLENAVFVEVEALDTMKSPVIQVQEVTQVNQIDQEDQVVKPDQLKEIEKVEDGILQWVRFQLWPDKEFLDQRDLNGQFLHEKLFSNNSTMPWTLSKMAT